MIIIGVIGGCVGLLAAVLSIFFGAQLKKVSKRERGKDEAVAELYLTVLGKDAFKKNHPEMIHFVKKAASTRKKLNKVDEKLDSLIDTL